MDASLVPGSIALAVLAYAAIRVVGARGQSTIDPEPPSSLCFPTNMIAEDNPHAGDHAMGDVFRSD